jgi:hypothetical protein
MDREPIRLALIPSAVIVAGLVAVAAWGSGADWRVSVGLAAGQVLAFLGLGEFLRHRVTPVDSPRDSDGTPLVRQT